MTIKINQYFFIQNIQIFLYIHIFLVILVIFFLMTDFHFLETLFFKNRYFKPGPGNISPENVKENYISLYYKLYTVEIHKTYINIY